METKEIIKKNILDISDWGKDSSLEKFYPSQSGKCKRQIFLSKLNAKGFSGVALGTMEIDSAIKKNIMRMPEVLEHYDADVSYKYIFDDKIFWDGEVDLMCKKRTEFVLIQPVKSLEYCELKPFNQHENELVVAMVANQVKIGKVLYVDKSCHKMVLHTIEGKDAVYEAIVKKHKEVYQELVSVVENDIFKIPFDKCNCWACNNEKVNKEFYEMITATEEKHKELWAEYKKTLSNKTEKEKK